jgi:AraC-like DNA-binding protein
MQPLLGSRPLLRTRSLEETRAFLAGRAIELSAPRVAPDVRINGVHLSGLFIGYVAYGAPAKVRFRDGSSMWRDRFPREAASGDYWLQLPLHGPMGALLEEGAFDCDVRRGVAVSPGGRAELRSAIDSGRLSVSIRPSALERHLATLLNDMPRAPLRFRPQMRLDDGPGRRLCAILRWAAAELDAGGSMMEPRVAADLEHCVITWLLAAQPSNYSEALAKRARPVAPRDVKRALDYIHAHLAEPIALADLVRASGVAGRTLLKHFRDFHGVSPMRYVRNLRLQRVREELAAGRVAGVGESASRWGFTHAGRFSVEYRRRFGETPSATLRQPESP